MSWIAAHQIKGEKRKGQEKRNIYVIVVVKNSHFAGHVNVDFRYVIIVWKTIFGGLHAVE